MDCVFTQHLPPPLSSPCSPSAHYEVRDRASCQLLITCPRCWCCSGSDKSHTCRLPLYCFCMSSTVREKQCPKGFIPAMTANSPRSISGVLSAWGSAVHLPKFHYSTVNVALKIWPSERPTSLSWPPLQLYFLHCFPFLRESKSITERKKWLLSGLREVFVEEKLRH